MTRKHYSTSKLAIAWHTKRTLERELKQARAVARAEALKAKLKASGLLRFSKKNSKLNKLNQAIFSLPAGHSCLFARICLAFADRLTGKITDGPEAEVRCFAASGEAWATSARIVHWHNYEMLMACKSKEEMIDLISRSLPKNISLVRIDASGDFFHQRYFDAWLAIAALNPGIIFYAYTKALPLWVNRLGSIPVNFRLTASQGGTHDHLIAAYNLKSAVIVNYPHEAEALGLVIDHDDSNAWQHNNSFALLIHGTQRKGSIQAKAWSVQRQARQASKASK